jgi:hypothetical protein
MSFQVRPLRLEEGQCRTAPLTEAAYLFSRSAKASANEGEAWNFGFPKESSERFRLYSPQAPGRELAAPAKRRKAGAVLIQGSLAVRLRNGDA